MKNILTVGGFWCFIVLMIPTYIILQTFTEFTTSVVVIITVIVTLIAVKVLPYIGRFLCDILEVIVEKM